jgi:hypothetical protein
MSSLSPECPSSRTYLSILDRITDARVFHPCNRGKRVQPIKENGKNSRRMPGNVGDATRSLVRPEAANAAPMAQSMFCWAIANPDDRGFDGPLTPRPIVRGVPSGWRIASAAVALVPPPSTPGSNNGALGSGACSDGEFSSATSTYFALFRGGGGSVGGRLAASLNAASVPGARFVPIRFAPRRRDVASCVGRPDDGRNHGRVPRGTRAVQTAPREVAALRLARWCPADGVPGLMTGLYG